ncbi:Larval cuticle protein 8 [Lucilia cuprina]|uniref:Larval cuticle protein 8 n=1 Tax=Lucilia cuprina TaxID=7375 RepID=A0A0L0CNM8_LUCCU|nr:Larval cuticle protein 8 [Lucilia cuprina]
MKFIIVFAALFAVALAAPRPEDAVVLKSESEVGPESFQYAYATSDGVEAEAQGQLKNVGTDEEAIVVKGSFSFVADDGQTYTVNYVADENGFQPQVTTNNSLLFSYLSNRKMSTLGLETVSIGNIVDLISLTIITNVRVRTTYGNGFIFGASIFKMTLFLGTLSIAGFYSIVVVFRFNIAIVTQSFSIFVGQSKGEESNEYNDEFHFVEFYSDKGSTLKHAVVKTKTLYKMKFIIVFVALFAFALANKDAETLRYDSNVEPENYNYAVETSDGKSAQEEGHLENVGTEDEAIAVRGSYSYIGDDGQTYQVNYIADRNGFQPQGAHLPVA